ncbi:MAG: phosphatase PAP2 family protein [Planctomycetes bacterium]|nr:phosphatase PAP2 family protein [Planctomycetota bacterium]
MNTPPIAPLGIDRRLTGPIHRLVLGPLDYFWALPGTAFGTYAMPITMALVGLWLGWKVLVVGVAASLVTVSITQALKHTIGRDRPAPLLARRRVKLRSLVKNPSFPSGDSAQAGVVSFLVMWHGPFQDDRAYLFLIPLPLCMFARIYFGAHWIGDTLAGAAIGAGVMAGVHFAALQIPGFLA